MPSKPQSALGLSASSVILASVLFVLHQDFWLRGNSELVFGLPIGLAYHLGYCFAVSIAFGLLMRARR